MGYGKVKAESELKKILFGMTFLMCLEFQEDVLPPKLVKAHQELNKAVDLCYQPQAFTNEKARLEYLFDLYNEYTMPLLKKISSLSRT